MSDGRGGPLVIVEGLPGSGKTALARPLAVELGVAYIAKDVIKETLGDIIGAADLPASRLLGRASVEVLYALADDAPRAVLDSFWNPPNLSRQRLQGLGRPTIELFCRCPATIARDRAATRVRHSVHQDRAWLAGPGDHVFHPTAEFFEPLGLGGPVLEVDTTSAVDVPAVADWIRVQSEFSERRA